MDLISFSEVARFVIKIMHIKSLIKKALSPVNKIIYGITHSDGYLYIGVHCKIVGAKHIYFKNKVNIMPYTMLVAHGNATIKLGERTEIGMYSRIAAKSHVEFGKCVLTGPHVFIADYNHAYEDIDRPIMFQGTFIKSTDKIPEGGIEIGDGTWIGTNAVIVGTVSIGRNCVIGANSVVINDIPDYSVAVGSPARVVKQYDFETKSWAKV